MYLALSGLSGGCRRALFSNKQAEELLFLSIIARLFPARWLGRRSHAVFTGFKKATSDCLNHPRPHRQCFHSQDFGSSSSSPLPAALRPCPASGHGGRGAGPSEPGVEEPEGLHVTPWGAFGPPLCRAAQDPDSGERCRSEHPGRRPGAPRGVGTELLLRPCRGPSASRSPHDFTPRFPPETTRQCPAGKSRPASHCHS